MPSTPFDPDEAHLVEIAEQLDAVARFTGGVEEAAYLADEMRRMAVAMAWLIVGEAAGRLRQETRARAPEIDWPAIIALRNRIAHGYKAIDHRLVFAIAGEHGPILRSMVTRLMTEREG